MEYLTLKTGLELLAFTGPCVPLNSVMTVWITQFLVMNDDDGEAY